MSNSNQFTPPGAGQKDDFGVVLKKVGFDAKPGAAQQEERDKYQQLLAPQRFKPELMSEDDVELEILKKIPFISALLKRLDDIGENLAKFKEIENATNLSKLVHAFQYAGLAINLLNFLYIPILYLAGFIYNKKIPFTLPNNLKFAYASALLALSAVALAIPAIAPFIAIAASGSALFLAIGVVYQHYSSRSAIKSDLNELNQTIEEKTLALEAIQAQARVLTVDNPLFDELFEQFEQQRKELQTLHNQQAQKEQIYNGLSWDAGLIKAASVAIGATLVAGIALSIFFPPLGLTITAAAAGAGCSLVFVSIGKSIISSAMDYFKTAKEKTGSEVVDSSPTESEELGLQDDLSLSEPESGLSEVDTPANLSTKLSIPIPVPSPQAEIRRDELAKVWPQEIPKPLKTAPSIPSPLPNNDEEEEEGEGEHPHP